VGEQPKKRRKKAKKKGRIGYGFFIQQKVLGIKGVK
jgi:hypothetical protein